MRKKRAATSDNTAVEGVWRGRQVRQISQIALALFVALAISLIVTVDPTQAAPAPAPQIDQTRQEDPPPGPESEIPVNDEGALDDDFLRAYDRLTTDGANAATESDEGAIESDPASLVSTLAFSLLVIVGLIYGGIWLYKQYVTRQRGGLLSLNGQMLHGQVLTVQESQSIGPNQRLHVVRLGDETLLLGATDQTITLLARYDADQTLAQPPVTFADHLQEAVHSQQTDAKQPTDNSSASLQESLAELRRVQQTWQGNRSDG